jgi:hypothetical protein
MHSRNGDFEVDWTDDGSRLLMRANGEIILNDDDTDIVRIDDGDRVTIEERGVDGTSRIELKVTSDGRIERRWLKDGRERPYEPEGRAWLARRLPTIVRRTGIAADQRVTRILARSGPAGVLQEVSLIPSDFVKGRYVARLLAATTLDEATTERLLDQVGREVKSDFELGRILGTVAKRGLASERLRLAYVRNTSSIESDFESTRALTTLVKAMPITSTVASAIFARGASIESDFELGRLLNTVVTQPSGRETVNDAFFAAVQTIQSDFECGRVLGTVVRQGELTDAQVLAVLDAIRSIESSFEAARVLTSLVAQQRLSEGARSRSIEVAQRLGSAFERERVLARIAVLPSAR